MKLIDNASGNIKQTIPLTDVDLSGGLKIGFNCNNIGSGKSYIRIYASISKGYETYFIPIQFAGKTEFEFAINTESTVLEFEMIGNASVTHIVLESLVNIDTTLEYVKENKEYWDRIKDVTNNVGKLRAETLEGLINLTLNAFANESGTITQENGVLTFLDGTTVAKSTMAVQITGGAIRIANSKLPNGEWNWSTALTGAGINADTIVAGTLRAIAIDGVKITGTEIIGGKVTGVEIKGNTIKGNTIEGNTINGGTINGTTVNGSTIKGGSVIGSTVQGGIIRGDTAIYSGDETSTHYMEILHRNIKGYGQDRYGNKQEVVGIYTGTDKGSISLSSVGSSPASMDLITDITNQSTRQCGIYVNSNKPFYIKYNNMFIAFTNDRITIQPQNTEVYVAGTLRADKIIDSSKQLNTNMEV